jgi:hypothetical protein
MLLEQPPHPLPEALDRLQASAADALAAAAHALAFTPSADVLEALCSELEALRSVQGGLRALAALPAAAPDMRMHALGTSPGRGTSPLHCGLHAALAARAHVPPHAAVSALAAHARALRKAGRLPEAMHAVLDIHTLITRANSSAHGAATASAMWRVEEAKLLWGCGKPRLAHALLQQLLEAPHSLPGAPMQMIVCRMGCDVALHWTAPCSAGLLTAAAVQRAVTGRRM